MNRNEMINRIGNQYLTTNIENDEYSYVKVAGSQDKLINNHYKVDIRFQNDDVVILIETKQKFSKADEKQLASYVENEIAINHSNKIICMLANTSNDKIKVWRNSVDDDSLLKSETSLKSFEHYADLFKVNKQNNREIVLKNTFDLNVLLHKMDIKESLRSQFVGSILLYIKNKSSYSWRDIIALFSYQTVKVQQVMQITLQKISLVLQE